MQTLLHTYKSEKNNFFPKQRYLFLNNFNNRNATTKTRFSSSNAAINSTKQYHLQEDIKISKNCQRKEIENEIHTIFSCDKYGNIQRKALNGINEVDNINFQTKDNIEKLELLQTFFRYFSLDSSWGESLYSRNIQRK